MFFVPFLLLFPKKTQKALAQLEAFNYNKQCNQTKENTECSDQFVV